MLFKQLIFVILVLLHTALANNKKEYYDVNNWESVTSLFESFLQEHDKNYDGAEKYQRLNIFLGNLKEINRLNAKNPKTIFGITYFADLTAKEMISYKGYQPSLDMGSCSEQGDPTTHDAPTAYDWREQNAVTPVKNQQRCGSCWAFSATATVESSYAISSGQQVDLSEQQLVDCDEESSGCNGGYPAYAFTKLIQEGGQEQESDYPYSAVDGSCQYESSRVAVKVASCSTYDLSSEDTLKELLFKQGPLSIVIDASQLSSYTGGVFTECTNSGLDHAVQLVGYGTDAGTDFWVIKNSWGDSWGENGFFRVQRGVQCLGLLNSDVASVAVS